MNRPHHSIAWDRTPTHVDQDAGAAEPAGLNRRTFVATSSALALSAVTTGALAQSSRGADQRRSKFRRVATQFIAALGAEDAVEGNNAETWGLWAKDPGPRGVRLSGFEALMAADGVAPAQWTFDSTDWWLEEHGLIMEPPEFPLAAGQYLVTGDRAATAVLTVHAKDEHGQQRWSLDSDATLYDVTHLGCRSARYTSSAGAQLCSPAEAQQSDFPVTPGGPMPPVSNCSKQDYAVLFVIGLPLDS